MMTGSDASARTIRVWDLPLRVFHWLLVAIIAVAFISAEEDSLISAWHVSLGWAAAVLIAFRIVWGFVGGENARFASFPSPTHIPQHLASMFARRAEAATGHSDLGAFATIVILGLVGAVIYSGAFAGEELHEGLASGLLVVIGVHVIAVVITSLLTRDNLIRAFITGCKRASLYPGVGSAGPPAGLALPVAALAIGGAAYGFTVLDPTEFSPGMRDEAGESGTLGGSGEGSDGD